MPPYCSLSKLTSNYTYNVKSYKNGQPRFRTERVDGKLSWGHLTELKYGKPRYTKLRYAKQNSIS